MNMKRALVGIISAAMALSLTACSKNTVSDVKQFIQADGRDYGSVNTVEMGETQRNSFFSLRVDEAYRYSTLGDWVPNDGYDFLAVKIYTQNIFTDSIPMGLYDFSIRWGDGENDWDQAFSMEGETTDYFLRYYPEETTLSVGGSAEGYIFFTVPKSSTDLRLEYIELYEDDFEGSTYYTNLGNPVFSPNDIKPEDVSYGGETIVGEIGDTLSTCFFDIKVNDAFLLTSLNGNTPDEGYTIVAADITVTNPNSDATFACAGDFVIFYDEYTDGGTEEYYDTSIDVTDYVDNTEAFFPEYVDLNQGGTAGGIVIFCIPEDSVNLKVVFDEYFDDDTYGNSYEIELGDLKYGSIAGSENV